ncbi:hypothetical protein [Rubinisphaera sp.]|uniref:hypothetical protein n=1 Tax=Rubinisphaera sp. TaxID=2024857 RepID=UPI000C0FFA9F|nr:hypothetical protein [Rubinisphaera sp.]MBV08386.1 hypothetical protein [Rubinisphaera sp.]HCS55586.1 hypothetical protein [Planctomycetaceae bacterium]|tara:strand:- start:1696 stop:2373 length:678 start_codon:yes stop_codon:yes gene_type:complete
MTLETWDEWEILWTYEWQEDDVKRHWKSSAEKLGLNPWDLTIFDSIWYSHGQGTSLEFLSERSFGNSQHQYPDQVKRSIERVFTKGWLQFLDVAFVDRMTQHLNREGYEIVDGLIGTYERDDDSKGLEGVISFTEDGAAIYKCWFSDLWPDKQFVKERDEHWAIAELTDDQYVVYGETLEACQRALQHRAVKKASSPETVGRWCDRWWNKFESGVRIFYEVYEQD